MAPMIIDIHHAHDARDVVHRAVQALAEGRLVAFPTETVYGLAAAALNRSAVKRLVEVTQDDPGRHYTLAIKSGDEALDYVPDLTRLAERLVRRCWPGPVTLKLPAEHPEGLIQQLPGVVQQLVGAGGVIQMRVPAHSLILDVLRLIRGPLVLTHASRQMADSPVTAAAVVNSLGDDVHMVLDDGRSQFAQPSTVVTVHQHRLQIDEPGVVSAETLERLASMLILFVCTGNTCRSPMAEALCRKMLAERLGCKADDLEDRGISVTSAGIAAMAGGGPSSEAVEVVADFGMDLASHVTQPISDRLVNDADVIFTMTEGHRQALVGRWPEASSRTSLLCGEHIDVADPIGGPRELYRRCAEQMKTAIKARIDELDLPESTS